MDVCFASFQITDQSWVLNKSQKPYSVAQTRFPSSFISSPPWHPRPSLAFTSLSGYDSASHFTGHRLDEPSPPSLHPRALHLTTPLPRKVCSAQRLFIQWLFTITTSYSFAPFPAALPSHANKAIPSSSSHCLEIPNKRNKERVHLILLRKPIQLPLSLHSSTGQLLHTFYVSRPVLFLPFPPLLHSSTLTFVPYKSS